jgi:hypothetical protein
MEELYDLIQAKLNQCGKSHCMEDGTDVTIEKLLDLWLTCEPVITYKEHDDWNILSGRFYKCCDLSDTMQRLILYRLFINSVPASSFLTKPFY